MANIVKKRIFYMDELRALAILGVILMHTTSTYRPFIYNNLKLGIPGILNALGCIGIPIFFMLSGALLLNRNYTISEFFKKRYTRILGTFKNLCDFNFYKLHNPKIIHRFMIYF